MSNFNPAEYWESRLRGNVALDKVGYLGLGKHYNQWLYRVRKTVFRRTVRSLEIDLANSSVLDIGSGTGFYIQQWKDLGTKELVGLDITTAAVEHLRARFPDTPFYKADITEDTLPVCGAKFDIISAFDVLFHIVDEARYRSALANIYSLLRPGGLFLFSDMFPHNETPTCQHVLYRRLAHIEEALHERGLHVLGRRPVFVLMSEPLDSTSRTRKLLWRGIQRAVSVHETSGFIVGGALYPLEVLLTSLLKESSSTEVMICREPDAGIRRER